MDVMNGKKKMIKNTCIISVLPHHREIKVKTGTVLMEALMAKNIFLRSDCGGRGVCEKCRVKLKKNQEDYDIINACQLKITTDVCIKIPDSSLMSSHIITKAPIIFERRFKKGAGSIAAKQEYGLAVDLGTTTIAVYLCDIGQREVVSSLAVKNPQALFGDDVMSRISAIVRDKKNLSIQQNLVVNAIQWGVNELIAPSRLNPASLFWMSVVGNPAMIHIFLGVDPSSIGVYPFQPAFFNARQIAGEHLGFKNLNVMIQTLPQVSGFIGADILSAALAVDFKAQPAASLLMDLGTNGELLLNTKDKIFATSCATGPAFEGASLSCGMQALPGAVDRIEMIGPQKKCTYSVIKKKKAGQTKPSGICGTGVISAIARFYENEVIDSDGRLIMNAGIPAIIKDKSGQTMYVIVPKESPVSSSIGISQKDIRSVQLGKAALMTGIEFLMKEAEIRELNRIIIAGAFGSHIKAQDMMTLGMIPRMPEKKISLRGNAAGAGAVMALCDKTYISGIRHVTETLCQVDLASQPDFQKTFVKNLNFP